MKKKKIVYRNPVARDMLQDRKSPQVIPPKKGNKAKHNRRKDKEGLKNEIRNEKLYQDN